MDARTLHYYAEHAQTIADRYEAVQSPMAQWFDLAFAPGSKVLDIGSGSGRDLAALLARGFDAYGVEPCDPLRLASIEYHPELQNRVYTGALPDLRLPNGLTFNGVLCSAVLMHLPEHVLLDAAKSIRKVMNDGARLLLSLPDTRVDLQTDNRDVNGRLFTAVTTEGIQALFEQSDFRLLNTWRSEDALGRSGTSWFTMLMECGKAAG